MTTNELEEEFDKAMKLFREEGDLDGAYKNFEELARLHPWHAGIFGMMGHIDWNLERWENAVRNFSLVVKLSPKSELGSLCLFLSLLELGKYEDSFDEARRYLNIAYSKDHEDAIRELRVNVDVEPEERERALKLAKTQQDLLELIDKIRKE